MDETALSQHPTLAVVLPSYNPGPELSWTLDSLRAQTAPFKLFVVDDGSRIKPDYHALLAGFDYELIELAQNVGPCTVRNAAVRMALDEGFDVIAQMDTGDWAFPTRLEEQLDYLIAHPDIGLVGSQVEILDNDLNHSYVFRPPTTPEGVVTGMYYNAVFKHPAMMYRADLLRQIGLYTDEFDVAEDFELAHRAARVTKLANVPSILLKEVEYTDGVSATRRFAQLFSRLRIQWRYRDIISLHSWLGMARTLILIVTPVPLLRHLKAYFHQKGQSRPSDAAASPAK